MKRRDFMITSAVAGVALASERAVKGNAPTMLIPQAFKPLVVASANGNRFKNGGEVTAVQIAYSMITKGDDVLDAVIAGVNINELDPLDDSVGYGGLAEYGRSGATRLVGNARPEETSRRSRLSGRHSDAIAGR